MYKKQMGQSAKFELDKEILDSSVRLFMLFNPRENSSQVYNYMSRMLGNKRGRKALVRIAKGYLKRNKSKLVVDLVRTIENLILIVYGESY